MIDPLNPDHIARTRIAEEAERRTGTLDLGGLGLRRLPDALFELTHLRRLNLGGWPWADNSLFLRGYYGINSVGAELHRLIALVALEGLCISKTTCLDLGPVGLLK